MEEKFGSKLTKNQGIILNIVYMLSVLSHRSIQHCQALILWIVSFQGFHQTRFTYWPRKRRSKPLKCFSILQICVFKCLQVHGVDVMTWDESLAFKCQGCCSVEVTWVIRIRLLLQVEIHTSRRVYLYRITGFLCSILCTKIKTSVRSWKSAEACASVSRYLRTGGKHSTLGGIRVLLRLGVCFWQPRISLDKLGW